MTIHENNDIEPIQLSAMGGTDKHVEKPIDIHEAPNTPIVKKPKRKQNTEEESPMLKKAFKILNETSSATDSYFTYGQHIANELRKYDQRTLIYVKNAINNVIFEADLGYYTYGHTQYNTTQNSTPSPQPPVPSQSPAVHSPQLSVTYQSPVPSPQSPSVYSPQLSVTSQSPVPSPQTSAVSYTQPPVPSPQSPAVYSPQLSVISQSPVEFLLQSSSENPVDLTWLMD